MDLKYIYLQHNLLYFINLKFYLLRKFLYLAKKNLA